MLFSRLLNGFPPPGNKENPNCQNPLQDSVKSHLLCIILLITVPLTQTNKQYYNNQSVGAEQLSMLGNQWKQQDLVQLPVGRVNSQFRYRAWYIQILHVNCNSPNLLIWCLYLLPAVVAGSSLSEWRQATLQQFGWCTVKLYTESDKRFVVHLLLLLYCLSTLTLLQSLCQCTNVHSPRDMTLLCIIYHKHITCLPSSSIKQSSECATQQMAGMEVDLRPHASKPKDKNDTWHWRSKYVEYHIIFTLLFSSVKWPWIPW